MLLFSNMRFVTKWAVSNVFCLSAWTATSVYRFQEYSSHVCMLLRLVETNIRVYFFCHARMSSNQALVPQLGFLEHLPWILRSLYTSVVLHSRSSFRSLFAIIWWWSRGWPNLRGHPSDTSSEMTNHRLIALRDQARGSHRTSYHWTVSHNDAEGSHPCTFLCSMSGGSFCMYGIFRKSFSNRI